MRLRWLALALLGLTLAGCAGGNRQEATHRAQTAGNGSAEEATSPTVNPDVPPAPSALPRAVVERARVSRGNFVPIGILTAAVLVVGLGLGLYTLALVFLRSRARRAYPDRSA